MLGPWTLITAGEPKELLEPGESNCNIKEENVTKTRLPFRRVSWKVTCCTTPHLMEERRSFCKEDDEQLGDLVRGGKEQHVAQKLHHSFHVDPERTEARIDARDTIPPVPLPRKPDSSCT